MEKQSLIEGDVTDIVFHNESNGYTVCVLKTADQEVTAVGNIPFISVGEKLKITGQWVVHRSYGDQLKVQSYERCEPDTLERIEKSLASGLIKGIGPVTAKKIVQKFELEAFDIIETTPEKLSQIKGISEKKAKEIGASYQEKAQAQRTIIAFGEYGIAPSVAMRIYQVFGNRSLERVKENPYCLTQEVIGIGFKTADAIAGKIGISPDSDDRVMAGIRYVLTKAAGFGHTYLPQESLIDQSADMLRVGVEQVENLMTNLALDMQITIEKTEEESRIYLTPFYMAEKNAARKLLNISRIEYQYDETGLDERIAESGKKNEIVLAEEQIEAVKRAMTRGVAIITGGPGTGKTTIIQTIIDLLEQDESTFCLAAPTGRAAKRMSQATNREAKTIHRLLELSYKENEDNEESFFAKNETDPLVVDVVIIDEMSMVDILLFHHLLKAIQPGTRLIMVGDANQLPSVGPGNVLRDLLSVETIPRITLTKIFRQDALGLITLNAHKINDGHMPSINKKGGDFYFLKTDNMDAVVQTVIDLVQKRLPDTYGSNPKEDIQVLVPVRKGPAGVQNFNAKLQEVLNPKDQSKKEYNHRDSLFREGDKVMQIKNNYRLHWTHVDDPKIDGEGIFNGDIGLIQTIDHEEHTATILFEDRFVIYELSNFDDLEPAYAVTIHKSQGNEFPTVVLPIYPGPPMLMTRNLLYTAVTRAKNLVVLVGMPYVLKRMIENMQERKRYSGLKDKLTAYDPEEDF